MIINDYLANISISPLVFFEQTLYDVIRLSPMHSPTGHHMLNLVRF